MRALSCKSSFAGTLVCVLCGVIPPAANAQNVRDSAGIRIIENARPAWSTSDALRLSAAPTLIIGTRPDPSYELSRVAGAARLSDGRISVADGGSLELRFFDSAGTFLNSVGGRGDGPGEFREIDRFTRMPGDTLVVVGGRGIVSFFTGRGQFVSRITAVPPPSRTELGIKVVVEIMSGQSFVVATLPDQSRRRSTPRWIDSVQLVLLNRDLSQRKDLGPFPIMQMVMDESTPRPPWFGATAVFASDGIRLFLGYGGEYSIHVYSFDGKLQQVIRRRWTPVRVTRADIDAYVTEWSKRWIRSTGAQAEREKQDLRDDPYASEVPAFSQFLIDRTGRLWVREAHLADAPFAGNLATSPLVPSVWSVFDRTGRWLGDVTMPARFMPTDIGADYVLGIARDSDGVETVVQFRMGTAAQLR
jgi:hypothetical protein